jgi:hypothetical protein
MSAVEFWHNSAVIQGGIYEDLDISFKAFAEE